MSNKYENSESVQEIWSKLNSRWSGTDATAFYKEYIIKTVEIVDSFDDACVSLENMSSELMKELQNIELSFANQ